MLVGPQRLPEGLKEDTTPKGIKERVKKLMGEKNSEGGTRSREEVAFDVCLAAADTFGYDVKVSSVPTAKTKQ